MTQSRTMDEKQRILSETIAQRDEAEALLRVLQNAKATSEENLAQLNQSDFLKKVTGKSSIDNAIASTRRLVDAFNRVVDDLRLNLTDEDIKTLGGVEPQRVNG